MEAAAVHYQNYRTFSVRSARQGVLASYPRQGRTAPNLYQNILILRFFYVHFQAFEINLHKGTASSLMPRFEHGSGFISVRIPVS